MVHNCNMNLTFHKYQGTGNDFIIIDNRQGFFPKKDSKIIKALCDRKFGIGADGLILLEDEQGYDFAMVYFNSDGAQSTMCGNGGRCLVAFAKALGIVENTATFIAADGSHTAKINGNQILLGMTGVETVHAKKDTFFIDTGSPHHIQFVSKVSRVNVKQDGAKLRYGIYGKKGANINFVGPIENHAFPVRTYERGVEDETLSCGTGVTAVAIALHKRNPTLPLPIQISTLGGLLKVYFAPVQEGYQSIVLEGPAAFVFQGQINI